MHDNEEVSEGYEPNPSFKSLLSKWKSDDQKSIPSTDKSCGHIYSYARRKSKDEAKRDHFSSKQKQTGLEAKMTYRQPKNIYQQPLLTKPGFKPPMFLHTWGEKSAIRLALSNNYVFSDLSERDLEPLVSAFEKCVFKKGDTIIKQGDRGDYFYIIHDGKVSFQVNGDTVGKATTGASFGELALLYTCPRAATVKAEVDSLLFRVDHTTFRFMLQAQTEKSEKEKVELLKAVDFAQNLTDSDIRKLSAVMTPRVFTKGDLLVRKGDLGDAFYVIQEGTVLVKDISVGSTVYEDQKLGPGEYFGERALVTCEPRAANVVALTSGIAFSIDQKTFEIVLGSMSSLILKAQDSRKLAGTKLIQNASLDPRQIISLTNLIDDRKYTRGTKILHEGEKCQAAFFYVREGTVVVSTQSGETIVKPGGYFGEETVKAAASKFSSSVTIAPYTATAMDDCILGVLKLSACRLVFNTQLLSEENENVSRIGEQVREELDTPLWDLKRHVILGEGTFGQVWMVSDTKAKDPKPYALKIQSKYDLIHEGQAPAVLREKNIMSQLLHPFIINLVKTYQDEYFVYMLLDLVQGGELFSIMHEDGVRCLPESQSKFYALCIADALDFMHSRKIVYRDLKPENVLIDVNGYPVIVDFGFAKYVTDKTFTLCGTPGYLPPEVIMTRGHNCSADNWSLGILIYEMITGENPFYFDGMDQSSLFRSIVQDPFEPPLGVSPAAVKIIQGLLVKDPTRRLGSLAKGEREIIEHEWFLEFDVLDLRGLAVPAPWVPCVKDPFDISFFDDWSDLEDKTLQRQSKLSKEDQIAFRGF